MPFILTAADADRTLADALAELSELHRDILASHFFISRSKNETRKKHGLTRRTILGRVHDPYDDALAEALVLLRQAMRRRGVFERSDLPGM
ncbi:MAG TPA: hypothetical protein VFQ91_00680 [Bryobacteraceae bacterium]|nr:hypothetical protein [Bryobacteraceae bacterium]